MEEKEQSSIKSGPGMFEGKEKKPRFTSVLTKALLQTYDYTPVRCCPLLTFQQIDRIVGLERCI